MMGVDIWRVNGRKGDSARVGSDGGKYHRVKSLDGKNQGKLARGGDMSEEEMSRWKVVGCLEWAYSCVNGKMDRCDWEVIINTTFT